MACIPYALASCSMHLPGRILKWLFTLAISDVEEINWDNISWLLYFCCCSCLLMSGRKLDKHRFVRVKEPQFVVIGTPYNTLLTHSTSPDPWTIKYCTTSISSSRQIKLKWSSISTVSSSKSIPETNHQISQSFLKMKLFSGSPIFLLFAFECYSPEAFLIWKGSPGHYNGPVLLISQ